MTDYNKSLFESLAELPIVAESVIEDISTLLPNENTSRGRPLDTDLQEEDRSMPRWKVDRIRNLQELISYSSENIRNLWNDYNRVKKHVDSLERRDSMTVIIDEIRIAEAARKRWENEWATYLREK